jgi:hypothetical protein
MATTSRLAIPYPALAGTDIDDVPNWMNQMAVRLDAIIAPTSHGPLASRPVSSGGTPGIADRIYVATDVNPTSVSDAAGGTVVLYRDNGTGWDAIGPFASKIAMGAFNPPATAIAQNITGLGFKPKLVEFQFVRSSLGPAVVQMGMGAFTETFQYAAFTRESTNGTDQFWVQNEATVVHIDTPLAITEWAAAKNSPAMLADGFSIVWSIVSLPNTNARIIWKAWG